MNLAFNSKKILICGQSGQGKSTYFARLLANAHTYYGKVFVYDHQGEMAVRLNKPSAFTPDDLGKQFEQGFVCFDPSELFQGDLCSGWDFFCEWVFERCQKNIGCPKLIAVDEIQMLSSTAEQSWEQCCVVETGRKWELDFLAVSQQLNLIHNRLRNQLNEMVVFRQEEKLILDVLKQKGFDIDEVAALQKGHFILKSFQTGEIIRGSIDLTRR